MQLVEILARLAEGQTLSAEQAQEAVTAIMRGACSEAEIASFLTALRVRGETVQELAGAATAMRQAARAVPSPVSGLLDTCGTGGDCSGTFNISTATAIVVSACGVPVAKHGNRSVSSSSGSADVLKALGVNVEADSRVVHSCLTDLGLGFFFAPQWHPAMKHAMPVRRALRFRTIFNFLGPLCNPAGAEHQLLGVARWEWAEKMAETLQLLGSRSATVVSGADGLDEVTLAAQTLAVRVSASGLQVQTWTAESFGLPAATLDDWRVGSAQESAAVIRGILDRKPGPARDIVLANSAAAMLTAGRVESLPDGVTLAREAIDNGTAWRQLDELALRTNRPLSSASRGGD